MSQFTLLQFKNIWLDHILLTEHQRHIRDCNKNEKNNINESRVDFCIARAYSPSFRVRLVQTYDNHFPRDQSGFRLSPNRMYITRSSVIARKKLILLFTTRGRESVWERERDVSSVIYFTRENSAVDWYEQKRVSLSTTHVAQTSLKTSVLFIKTVRCKSLGHVFLSPCESVVILVVTVLWAIPSESTQKQKLKKPSNINLLFIVS